MKVIPIKKSGRIAIPLPNGVTFFAEEADMHSMFENPNALGEGEKEGLLQLALAVVFADHKTQEAAGMSR